MAQDNFFCFDNGYRQGRLRSYWYLLIENTELGQANWKIWNLAAEIIGMEDRQALGTAKVQIALPIPERCIAIKAAAGQTMLLAIGSEPERWILHSHQTIGGRKPHNTTLVFQNAGHSTGGQALRFIN